MLLGVGTCFLILAEARQSFECPFFSFVVTYYSFPNSWLYFIVHHLFSLSLGPVFGNMDKFVGLGVFVDTYPNEEKQQEVMASFRA